MNTALKDFDAEAHSTRQLVLKDSAIVHDAALASGETARDWPYGSHEEEGQHEGMTFPPCGCPGRR